MPVRLAPRAWSCLPRGPSSLSNVAWGRSVVNPRFIPVVDGSFYGVLPVDVFSASFSGRFSSSTLAWCHAHHDGGSRGLCRTA